MISLTLFSIININNTSFHCLMIHHNISNNSNNKNNCDSKKKSSNNNILRVVNLLVIIFFCLFSLLFMIGCTGNQINQPIETNLLDNASQTKTSTPEFTFYSKQCITNYYEYTTGKTNIENVSGHDDNYYFYIDYNNNNKSRVEHAIFPKCEFIQSQTQFSNILNSIRYPCCNKNSILKIHEYELNVETIRKAVEYLFISNNVQQFHIKSITESDDEFFITVNFLHNINEGQRGGTKKGNAYFKLDKKTRNLYEINEQITIINRWDAPFQSEK